MNRLFKSALFPILVVLVLAFFALKIVNSSSSSQSPKWRDLVAATNHDKVTSIKSDLAGNSVTYTEAGSNGPRSPTASASRRSSC